MTFVTSCLKISRYSRAIAFGYGNVKQTLTLSLCESRPLLQKCLQFKGRGGGGGGEEMYLCINNIEYKWRFSEKF